MFLEYKLYDNIVFLTTKYQMVDDQIVATNLLR